MESTGWQVVKWKGTLAATGKQAKNKGGREKYTKLENNEEVNWKDRQEEDGKETLLRSLKTKVNDMKSTKTVKVLFMWVNKTYVEPVLIVF